MQSTKHSQHFVEVYRATRPWTMTSWGDLTFCPEACNHENALIWSINKLVRPNEGSKFKPEPNIVTVDTDRITVTI